MAEKNHKTCDFLCWFLFHLVLLIFYAHKKRRLVINYFQNCLFRSVMRTSSSFRMSRVYMIFLDIFLMEPNMRNPTKKVHNRCGLSSLRKIALKRALEWSIEFAKRFHPLHPYGIRGLMILTPCFHKTKSKMYRVIQVEYHLFYHS